MITAGTFATTMPSVVRDHKIKILEMCSEAHGCNLRLVADLGEERN
jgi:hypothetical protein